jgi:hypothetical protein
MFKTVLAAMISLHFALGASFADPSFAILGADETSLPLDTFVFAVQNIETGVVHYGYTREAPTEITRRVKTLLPGHTMLMAHDLQVSERDFLLHHLPAEKQGKYVCGGFYSRMDGLYIHPFFSAKGAGQLEPSVDPLEPVTGNPMLPIQNPHVGSHIAKAYLPSFFNEIVRRFRRPLVLDKHRIRESPYFKWNAAKHTGMEIPIELVTDRTARPFFKAAIAANRQILGVGTRSVPNLLRRVLIRCALRLEALRELRDDYRHIKAFQKSFENQ